MLSTKFVNYRIWNAIYFLNNLYYWKIWFETKTLCTCNIEKNRRNSSIIYLSYIKIVLFLNCQTYKRITNYVCVLSDYFWRKIEDYYLEDMWFQQYRVTSLNTLTNRALLPKKIKACKRSCLLTKADGLWTDSEKESLNLLLDTYFPGCEPAETTILADTCSNARGSRDNIWMRLCFSSIRVFPG